MTPTSSRAPANHRPMVAAVSLIVLALLLGGVLFIALRSPLKDDIAWLLYVARCWMAGRELYIDIIEVNPPLIVWISTVPLQLGRWLDIDPQLVVVPVFVAAVLGCAWWTAALLRSQGGIFAERLAVFTAIGAALLILPAADLGQREHLLVAAFLPYLVLFSQSLDRASLDRASLDRASAARAALAPGGPTRAGRVPDTSCRSIAAWLVAGGLAGLGCALKPRYAAAFAVLEGLALLRGLPPWRLMPIAAAIALAGYAGLVATLCPAYWSRAVPMALALYGATDAPFPSLLADSAWLLFGQAAAIALLWLRRRSLPNYNLMLTLVVFAATSTIVCFIDGKDWYYHRLPATIATVLALMLWIATELLQRRWQIRWPLIVAGLAVAVFCAASIRQLQAAAVDAVDPGRTALTVWSGSFAPSTPAHTSPSRNGLAWVFRW